MNRARHGNARTSGLARQSRHKKALFLPMDRASANDLVLPVRIAFDLIRQGKPDRAGAVCMAEILLLVGFLTEDGFGSLETSFLADVERRLLAELNERTGGETWTFPVDLVEHLGVVVNEYDRLLRETRLQAIVAANERFARLSAASRQG